MSQLTELILRSQQGDQQASEQLVMENAGLNAQALLAEVEKAKDGMGVNVMEPEKGLVDLKKAGVIDPAKVTKEAVKNATSIAATAMTMGALICEIPEDKPASPEGMY